MTALNLKTLEFKGLPLARDEELAEIDDTARAGLPMAFSAGGLRGTQP
jgi:hypothetical protein